MLKCWKPGPGVRYPRSKQELLEWRCRNCRGLQCVVCGGVKARDCFSKSVLYHRKTQSVRCIDCSSPACTSPGCKTCKSCRDVTCNHPACAKTPVTLNSKLPPHTLEEVRNFKCANCEDDAMNLYTCVGCKKAKSGEAFDAADVKAHAQNSHRKNLLCLECVTQGRTFRDTEF